MYAGSEKEQANIITEHFKNIFTAVTVADEPTIIKQPKWDPFTPEEIEKASKSMKNQKSVGEDGLDPSTCRICKIWTSRNTQRNRNTAKYHSKNRQIPCRNQVGNTHTSSKTWKETGTASKSSTNYSALNNQKNPSHLSHSQMLGSPKYTGATHTIRLSVWTKHNRTGVCHQSTRWKGHYIQHVQYLLTATRHEQSLWHRLSKQTTYRPTRNTRTRWDSHDGSTYSIISDVVLTVKVGKELGVQIKTEVGIAQGDCLSAVLFIFYLAKSMTPNRECIEHNYASVEQRGNILPEECKDHDYYRKTEIKNYFGSKKKPQMI